MEYLTLYLEEIKPQKYLLVIFQEKVSRALAIGIALAILEIFIVIIF